MAFQAEQSGSIGKDEEMQRVLEATLLQAAATDGAMREQGVAKARIDAGNTEIGARKPEYIVQAGSIGIFGAPKETVDAEGNVTITRTQAPPPRPATVANPRLNTKALIEDDIRGVRRFDVEAELKKFETLPDETKASAAQTLLLNMETEMAATRARIRSAAEQRSGLTNAQQALELNLQADALMVSQGKMKPTDQTIQTIEARRTLAAAQELADKMMNVNLADDPQARRLEMQQKLLVRSLGKLETLEGRKAEREEMRESKQVYWTPEMLKNAKLMLGIEHDDEKLIKQKAQNLFDKDKDFRALVHVTKEELPSLLSSENVVHRRYAAALMENAEREHLGIPKNAPLESLPEDQRILLREIRKMVDSPESILKDKDKAELNTLLITTKGDKEKIRARHDFILGKLNQQIQDMGRNKYERVDGWVITEPQIKAVLDGRKALNPDGKLMMADAVETVIQTDIKKPDGTLMNTAEKTTHLMNSLALSMDNDKGSLVLPSASIYKPEYLTRLKNEITKQHIRKMSKNFPGMYGGFGARDYAP